MPDDAAPEDERDGATLSLRAARKAENRRLIVAAGRAVFAEIGLDAATVRDIVRASGLAQGSFYNYFDSKEAVFSVIVDEVVTPIRARLKEARAAATTADAFIGGCYRACVALTAQDYAAAALIRRNQAAFRAAFYQGDDLAGAVLRELVEDLEAAVARGLFAPHDAPLMAEMMLSAGVDLIIACLNAPEQTERRLAFLQTTFETALTPSRQA
ncbi:MAG: TetR/AcrR family transcriptional regulator [Pseudomonadota bacterium]